MSSEIKQNMKQQTTWVRGFYIVVFAFIYSIAEIVLAAVVFFQFLTTLFTGERNERLLAFGNNLGTFIYQVIRYLTYNSDDKPFPFDEWPGSEKQDYGKDEKEQGNFIEHT